MCSVFIMAMNPDFRREEVLIRCLASIPYLQYCCMSCLHILSCPFPAGSFVRGCVWCGRCDSSSAVGTVLVVVPSVSFFCCRVYAFLSTLRPLPLPLMSPFFCGHHTLPAWLSCRCCGPTSLDILLCHPLADAMGAVADTLCGSIYSASSAFVATVIFLLLLPLLLLVSTHPFPNLPIAIARLFGLPSLPSRGRCPWRQ